MQPIVEEFAVAAPPGVFLQRQRDEISEPTFRQRILIRKKPVVGTQSDLGPSFHRFGQQVRAEFARETRGERFGEEQPDVSAIAGARALQRRGHLEPAARLEKRARILTPVRSVQIDRDEKARLIRQHRIHAQPEVAALRIAARQMPADDLVGDRQKTAVGAIRAFDPRLLAHAPHPFVAARGSVAGAA